MAIEIWADLETRSECDLKKHGTHRYAEHPSTKIQLFSYAFDDGTVKLWSLEDEEPMPEDLKAAFDNPNCIFWFHNAWFDRNIIEHTLGIKIPITRWRCAMALALSHALPAGLEKLGEVLGLHQDFQKIKDGKRLVMKFCRPKKQKDGSLKWHTPETDPEDWQKYKEYCVTDTASMRAAAKKIPRWNYTGGELDLWFMDQTINSRGMYIDLDFVNSAVEMITGSQKILAAKTHELTEGEVEKASQRDAMLQHIFKQYGYDLMDLRKTTVESLLENDPELPEILRELLLIRLSTSTTSTAKYRKMVDVTSADSRVRGTIQYAGASRSLRDGGRMVQPQNMPRPTLGDGIISAGIEVLKTNSFEDSREIFDMFDTDPMELCSSALRYAISAAPGKKLVIADLSNIEGRGLAYLAKEEWKLKAFREYDAGIGPDLYKAAYAKAFGIKPEEVTKDQRQVGKVLELACFGPDTQVLTDNGYKDIVEVLITDKLWDGTQWVKHQGLVEKGVQKVVLVDGIKVTPEHLIRIRQTWQPAKLLASKESILSLALETGSENLPLSASAEKRKGHAISIWWKSNALAELSHIKYLNTTCAKEKVRGVMCALRSRRGTGENNITAMLTSLKIKGIEGGYLTGSRHVLNAAATKMILGIEITGVGGYRFTNLGEQIERLFWHTSSHLKGGINLISIWIGRMLTGITNLEISDLLRGVKTAITKGLSSKCNPESTTLSPVYDIAYAGANNRFTIKTNSGHLLVHNCGYGGGVGAIVTFATGFGIDLNYLADRVRPSVPTETWQEAERFYKWLDDQDKRAAKKRAIRDGRPEDWENYYKPVRTQGLDRDVHCAIDSLKRLWREGHPKIVQFWKDADDAIRNAIAIPKKRFYFGNGVYAIKVGNWVKLVLPSGHVLPYPAMKIVYGKKKERKPDDVDNEKEQEEDDNISPKGDIVFKGVNQYTRKWDWIKTAGAKICENLIQSFARDIFKYGQLAAENAGYPIILPVHDENVAECPDTDEYSAHELEAIMSTNPPWAADMPLAAEGFEAYRYRK